MADAQHADAQHDGRSTGRVGFADLAWSTTWTSRGASHEGTSGVARRLPRIDGSALDVRLAAAREFRAREAPRSLSNRTRAPGDGQGWPHRPSYEDFTMAIVDEIEKGRFF